jgi:hypothetical protein
MLTMAPEQQRSYLSSTTIRPSALTRLLCQHAKACHDALIPLLGRKQPAQRYIEIALDIPPLPR